MEESVELKDLTLRSYAALSSQDHLFFERHVSQADGMLGIGTGPSEWWAGHGRFVNVLNDAMGYFSIIAGGPQAFSEGTVGWMADNARLKIPGGKEIPLRLTLIFHQEEGEWKIIQWHSSIGVPDEDLERMALNVK